ncbi:MAG: flagellar export chaperone FliS [Ruminococcus sp.]|jgi:flagellar protein FliS|nr:flagellar export chaperone FliS [Ruminococcus sp.]
MTAANPYMKYKAAAAATMTPVELLLALYDKCILECRKAVDFIENENYIRANASIKRVEDIVDELRFCLDMKYEMSQNLKELYIYYKNVLIKANRRKDTALIESLIPHFTELREAFADAAQVAGWC